MRSLSRSASVPSLPQSCGPTQRIRSVDRAVALLQAIASSPVPPTVADLAVGCKLTRSTAWRLLGTLQYHGVVTRDPATQGYVLGDELIRLAAATDHEALLRRARPVLQRHAVKLQETLTLAVARGLDLVYVDQVDPPGVVRPSWIGKPISLHATSSGKVFLASFSSSEVSAILPPVLERFTSSTITDRQRLLADVKATRERGYGICASEYEEYSSGVAAPVFAYSGRLIAIVAIWAPSQRMTGHALSQYGKNVIAAAEELSALFRGSRDEMDPAGGVTPSGGS
jgi:DNA-binding IclR family transcriptional regulator